MPLHPETLGSYVGKIACFYELRNGVVNHCLPMQGARKLVGQVISVAAAPDSDPGAIPNALLTVRGRSGRTKEVYLVEQYTKLFDTWEEALTEQTLP